MLTIMDINKIDALLTGEQLFMARNQINAALAAEGLERYKIIVGNKSSVGGLTIEIVRSKRPKDCTRIYISVLDKRYRLKKDSMKINWEGANPIVDKKKFITKVKNQIEFIKQVEEFREAQTKQLEVKKIQERKTESQVEAALGVEFSYGHCFLKDDLTLKLKDGGISIEGVFTPEETIEMIKKVLEMRS